MSFPTNQDGHSSNEENTQDSPDKLLGESWVSEFISDKLNDEEAAEFSRCLMALRTQYHNAVFIDFINGCLFFTTNAGSFAQNRPNETDEELQARVIKAATTFGKRQEGEDIGSTI
jgi:hypothetical protein